MPLVVTQLTSVYGKNLSLTGAVFMTVTPYRPTTWQICGYDASTT